VQINQRATALCRGLAGLRALHSVYVVIDASE